MQLVKFDVKSHQIDKQNKMNIVGCNDSHHLLAESELVETA